MDWLISTSEVISTRVTQRKALIAQEEQYCKSLEDLIEKAENEHARLSMQVEAQLARVESYRRRTDTDEQTRKKLQESAGLTREKASQEQSQKTKESEIRQGLQNRIMVAKQENKEFLIEMKKKYNEDLSSHNELLTRLEHLQKRKAELRRSILSIQKLTLAPEGKGWSSWKRLVVQFASLMLKRDQFSERDFLPEGEEMEHSLERTAISPEELYFMSPSTATKTYSRNQSFSNNQIEKTSDSSKSVLTIPGMNKASCEVNNSDNSMSSTFTSHSFSKPNNIVLFHSSSYDVNQQKVEARKNLPPSFEEGPQNFPFPFGTERQTLPSSASVIYKPSEVSLVAGQMSTGFTGRRQINTFSTTEDVYDSTEPGCKSSSTSLESCNKDSSFAVEKVGKSCSMDAGSSFLVKPDCKTSSISLERGNSDSYFAVEKVGTYASADVGYQTSFNSVDQNSDDNMDYVESCSAEHGNRDHTRDDNNADDHRVARKNQPSCDESTISMSNMHHFLPSESSHEAIDNCSDKHAESCDKLQLVDDTGNMEKCFSELRLQPNVFKKPFESNKRAQRMESTQDIHTKSQPETGTPITYRHFSSNENILSESNSEVALSEQNDGKHMDVDASVTVVPNLVRSTEIADEVSVIEESHFETLEGIPNQEERLANLQSLELRPELSHPPSEEDGTNATSLTIRNPNEDVREEEDTMSIGNETGNLPFDELECGLPIDNQSDASLDGATALVRKENCEHEKECSEVGREERPVSPVDLSPKAASDISDKEGSFIFGIASPPSGGITFSLFGTSPEEGGEKGREKLSPLSIFGKGDSQENRLSPEWKTNNDTFAFSFGFGDLPQKPEDEDQNVFAFLSPQSPNAAKSASQPTTFRLF